MANVYDANGDPVSIGDRITHFISHTPKRRTGTNVGLVTEVHVAGGVRYLVEKSTLAGLSGYVDAYRGRFVKHADQRPNPQIGDLHE